MRVDLVCITVDLLLLVPDLDKLERSRPEVLLQLAHITPLTEESLGGRTELVLKDLFALKVSAFRTLHKLISVVLVAHLQVIESVEQGFDLLLALLDLAIELITVPLQLFFLLGRLDDIVGL